MLLKILTPFDIIEDGVSVTHYEPGEFDVTVPATIEIALRAGWAVVVTKTRWESAKATIHEA